MGQALSSFVSCCCTEPARDYNDTDFIYRTSDAREVSFSLSVKLFDL